jgi:two-component system cell cycle response regulator DivK
VKRVLIIEDDRFNRRLYRELLEEEGWKVELACSADEGLAVARAAPPDLIVMDIEMPGMDGLTATRSLKADATTSGVPVVIISAHALQEHETRALAVGGDCFLRKPLRFPEFQQTIRRLIDGR